MDAPVRPGAATPHALAAGTAESTLTPRQLGGLALLGELGARLGEAWQPEFAAPLAEVVQRAGSLFERHDLPGLLDDTLGALGALRASGLLAALRDNAAFIAQSLEQLQPLVLQLMQLAEKVPVDGLLHDLATARALLDKLRTLTAFFEQHLAAKTTETLVELGALWQQTELDAALRDAAETLGALHHDGTLARLRDASSMLASAAQSSNADALASGAVQSLGTMSALSSLPGMLRMAGDMAAAWQASAAIAADGRASKGGLGGLLHLLRDPATQQLMQRAVFTAQAVEHPAKPGPGPAPSSAKAEAKAPAHH